MIKQCPECKEEVKWDDDVFIGDNGEAYHKECVTAYPIGYSLFSLDGDYLAQSEDTDMLAVCVLNNGEYLDEEED